MFELKQQRRGFSLIEVLVSLTIFSIVIVVGVNTFLTTYRTAQKAAIENVLLEDARFIMKRLEAEIKANTIDYEEYFSRKVVQYGLTPDQTFYGRNHGLYDWQFFNGGRHPGTNAEDGIGSWCQAANGDYHRYPNAACVTGPLAISEDNSTGQHPSDQRQADSGSEVVATTSSVCVPQGEGYYDFDASLVTSNECLATSLVGHYNQEELYLISPDGEIKTVIRGRPGPTADQNVLGMVKMIAGEELNNIVQFGCDDNYPCADLNADTYRDPAPESGRGLFDDFVPITPLRTNIKSISFLIAPLEDPRRAFSEDFADVRIQPQVTILLTVEPVKSLQNIFQRQDLAVHLQTTVSSRVE